MIVFEELDTLLKNFSKFLKTKNERYGNYALESIGVFSEGNPNILLLVRIDDKLSRIKNSTDIRKNDVVDLIGYLILYMLYKGWTDFEEMID